MEAITVDDTVALNQVRALNFNLNFSAALAVLSTLSAPLSREAERLKVAIQCNLQSHVGSSEIDRKQSAEDAQPLRELGRWKFRPAKPAFGTIAPPPVRRRKAPRVWVIQHHEKVTIVGRIRQHIPAVFVFADDLLLCKVNTKASKARPGTYVFEYRLHSSLTKRLTESSRIVISTGIGILPYRRHKAAVLAVEHGDGKIETMLSSGFLVTKKGTLVKKRTTDDLWRVNILKSYREFSEYFLKTFGHPLFLAYGTLLGYCRSGDFIAHDDDFDAAYLSQCTTPAEVKQELINMIYRMVVDGHSIEISWFGGFFRYRRRSGTFDVFVGWFRDGHFIMPNTLRFPATPEKFLPLQQTVFLGTPVHIPSCPETFLEGRYGEKWRVPDPGYVEKTMPGARDEIELAELTDADYCQLVERLQTVENLKGQLKWFGRRDLPRLRRRRLTTRVSTDLSNQ
jgi:hypothetical protein